MHLNLFKQDVVELFLKQRGGHVEQWLYSDTKRKTRSGSDLWREFLKTSTAYYVLPNEIELIKEAAQKLSQAVPKINTIVDFGVGNKQALMHKVLPIIKALKSVNSYVGIDLSQKFLDAALTNLKEINPSIQFTGIEDNFYGSNLKLSGSKRLGLMFGSTITNLEMREGDSFPRDKIVQQLKHLKSLIGNDNHFLVTYDANNDPESAMRAYDNIFWSKHVIGIMHDVKPLTKGNFNPSAWRHKMVWNENSHVIHQCAVATQNQNFSIDEQDFEIKKGDRFVTVNNFKYPVELFQSMCKEAGFEVKQDIADNQNRMHLQHLIC